MSHYQTKISKITDANPAHVEAWMRDKLGTLDSLSASEFLAEVQEAAACAIEEPKLSATLADCMGIRA